MNSVPIRDGQVEEFVNTEAERSSYFDTHRTVVFVNGMKNSGEDHKESALALSMLQMCRVVGVFNQSEGFAADLGQCIADKWQFGKASRVAPVPLARGASGALDHAQQIAKSKGGVVPGRAEIMRGVLERNAAAAALFDLLRSRASDEHLIAHSQGNLILSNALSAVAAVDGRSAIQGRVVHAYGSPAVTWPPGITLLENGFTWDPVTWLAGFDWKFAISKVGMPSGSLQPVTHGFLEYVKQDPAFIINRFRWGSIGMTFSMDEKGLATALAQMDRNLPRVRLVFERLEQNHSSDVDDVAVEYVDMARKRSDAASFGAAIKAESALHKLLIRVMDKGWTSGREKDAITYLKGL